MGGAEGVAVGGVMLSVADLPVAVLLEDVLVVELSEGDGFGGLIPAVELLDAVLIIAPCVGMLSMTPFSPCVSVASL